MLTYARTKPATPAAGADGAWARTTMEVIRLWSNSRRFRLARVLRPEISSSLLNDKISVSRDTAPDNPSMRRIALPCRFRYCASASGTRR